jgi:hypothetical protein
VKTFALLIRRTDRDDPQPLGRHRVTMGYPGSAASNR